MTKILIDEAVVRQWLEWFLWFQSCRDEKAPMTSTQVRDSIRQALADAALDKKAENARKLGLDYMEGSAEQYEKELSAPAQKNEFKPDWSNYQQGLKDGAAEEREECAKVCEEEGLLWGQRYAAAIRARKTNDQMDS